MAAQVEKLDFQLRSFRIPLVMATRELSKNIEHQFDVGGDPQWAPLQASTYKRKGGAGSVLVRTEKLKRRASQYSRWDITKDSASYSLPSSVSYGYFHQTGFKHYVASGNTKRAKGSEDVPARPFVRLEAKQQRIIAKAFGMWFDERMAKVGK
jgi:phage gpG-like protein